MYIISHLIGFSRGAPGTYEDSVVFNWIDGPFSSVTRMFPIPHLTPRSSLKLKSTFRVMHHGILPSQHHLFLLPCKLVCLSALV